jgi:hypothetical protein
MISWPGWICWFFKPLASEVWATSTMRFSASFLFGSWRNRLPKVFSISANWAL